MNVVEKVLFGIFVSLLAGIGSSALCYNCGHEMGYNEGVFAQRCAEQGGSVFTPGYCASIVVKPIDAGKP